MARVLSVQAGRIAPVAGPGPELRSGIHKTAAPAGLLISALGAEGDEIGHPAVHGGPDQALLLFAASNYPAIEARLGRRLPHGSFGENLTVEGADERSVCIGDVWRAGEAEVEVTSPRGPCGTLARHLADPGIIDAIASPHRAGWYVRVLRGGGVRPGDALTLVSRPASAWTVERAAGVRRDRGDVEGARALLALSGLGARMRERMAARVAEAGAPSP